MKSRNLSSRIAINLKPEYKDYTLLNDYIGLSKLPNTSRNIIFLNKIQYEYYKDRIEGALLFNRSFIKVENTMKTNKTTNEVTIRELGILTNKRLSSLLSELEHLCITVTPGTVVLILSDPLYYSNEITDFHLICWKYNVNLKLIGIW